MVWLVEGDLFGVFVERIQEVHPSCVLLKFNSADIYEAVQVCFNKCWKKKIWLWSMLTNLVINEEAEEM